MEKSKEYYMKLALKEADKAKKLDEVPIGAIIVKDGIVIARAHNLREKKNSALAHAEIIAIEKACKKLDSWRLDGCEMYVTLEPCLMCIGAILQSRIKKVYYAAIDKKAGSVESVLDYSTLKYCHNLEYEGNILKDESEKKIKDFFVELRKNKKENK